MKHYFSFLRVFTFILYLIIFSLVGVSLPPTINFVNGFASGSFYGHFASYAVVMIFFYLFMKDFNLLSNKESSTMKFFRWYVGGVKVVLQRKKIKRIINKKYESNSIKRKKK